MRRALAAASVLIFTVAPAIGEISDWEKKTVERAVKTLAKSKDAAERREAIRTLSRFEDAEVVAPLTAALGDPDPSVRRQAADALWRVSEVAAPAEEALRRALEDSSPGVRVRAAAALESLGVPDEELVVAREAGLEAERLRDRILAARDLVGFVASERLVPPIVDVANAEADTWETSLGQSYLSPVDILERLVRREDRGFVEPVMAAVDDGNPGRRWLLKGLAELEPKPDGWNAALVAQLGSPRVEDRNSGLELLRNRTSEEDGVEDWIAAATASLDDSETRNAALWALQDAGGFAASATPRIAGIAASDENEQIRERAAEALENIGDRGQAFPTDTLRGVAETSLPVLTTMAVDDPDDDVRRAAIGALGELWVRAEEVLPTFLAVAADDSNTHNRFSAWLRIRDLGTDAESAADELRVIAEADPENSEIAEQVLVAIRSQAPDFDPTVTTGGGHGDGPAETDSGAALATLRSRGIEFGPERMWRAVADLEVETARLLLDAGINPDERLDDVGMRPLHVLYFSGCRVMSYPSPAEVTTLTNLLLERGADPNIEDDRGNTVLKLAASNCDGSVARILIAGGADMAATDKFDMTAFDTAIGVSAFSGSDVPEAFLDSGYRITPEKAARYRQSFADNPRILELLDRATTR